MQIPYLTGKIRERFDAWHEGNVERYAGELSFTEIRKGVQTLDRIYAHAPASAAAYARCLDGRGKRGAQACYFAAVHFMIASHALEMLGTGIVTPAERLIDLGCGTGATSAAIAANLDYPPQIVGIDRSAWALDEARRTWSSFGLNSRTRRANLPDTVPRGGLGDVLAAGWIVSELAAEERRALLLRLQATLRKDGKIFVIQPFSPSLSPWWNEWADALAPWGVRDEVIRVSIQRPVWIQEMDTAAKLDHQVLSARILAGPG